MEFKERLERSHSRAVARAERAVYHLQAAVAAAVTKGDLSTAQVPSSPLPTVGIRKIRRGSPRRKTGHLQRALAYFPSPET